MADHRDQMYDQCIYDAGVKGASEATGMSTTLMWFLDDGAYQENDAE